MELEELERYLRVERMRMDEKLETLQMIIDQIRAKRGEVMHKARIVCDLLSSDPMLRERQYILRRLK